MKLKSYLKNRENEVRTLNVWDIDDTLGKTNSRVLVKKDGKVVKVLETGEYNSYKLKTGEEFDFAQFRSGKVFRDTFKPINTVLDRAKEIIWNQSENSRSIILTARADFDDHKEFLQTFRDHGFPIDHVYVERAGNMSNLNPNSPAHINKGVIIKRYLNSGKWDRIRMWDDSEKNLDMLIKVAQQFPKIEAIAYLVKDGRVIRYASTEKKKNVAEEIKNVVKETFNRKMYGINNISY